MYVKGLRTMLGCDSYFVNSEDKTMQIKVVNMKRLQQYNHKN